MTGEVYDAEFLSELVWVVGVLEHSFLPLFGEFWLRSGHHMSREGPKPGTFHQ